jgi:hypothetical protein
MTRTVYVGGHAELDGSARRGRLRFAIDRLCTHGVVVGMTGSGKTGLLLVLIEEAVRNGVPVVVLDIKGDLANLALGCDGPASIAGYLSDHSASERVGAASALHDRRMRSLALWGLSSDDARALDRSLALRLFTPGSDAGESLHLLSALELPNARWTSHPHEAREALAAAISMVLRVLDRDDDPARSREHVLLSVLAERHLRAGRGATLDRAHGGPSRAAHRDGRRARARRVRLGQRESNAGRGAQRAASRAPRSPRGAQELRST